MKTRSTPRRAAFACGRPRALAAASRRERLGRADGFALLEAIVASVVLVVGLLTSFAVLAL